MRDEIPARIRQRIDERMQQQNNQQNYSQQSNMSGFQQPANNQQQWQQQTHIPQQYTKTQLSKNIHTFFLLADIVLTIMLIAFLYGVFRLP